MKSEAYLLLVIDKKLVVNWHPIASWGTPPVALSYLLLDDYEAVGGDERRRGGGRDLGKRVTSFAWWWCDKLV